MKSSSGPRFWESHFFKFSKQILVHLGNSHSWFHHLFFVGKERRQKTPINIIIKVVKITETTENKLKGKGLLFILLNSKNGLPTWMRMLNEDQMRSGALDFLLELGRRMLKKSRERMVEEKTTIASLQDAWFFIHIPKQKPSTRWRYILGGGRSRGSRNANSPSTTAICMGKISQLVVHLTQVHALAKVGSFFPKPEVAMYVPLSKFSYFLTSFVTLFSYKRESTVLQHQSHRADILGYCHYVTWNRFSMLKIKYNIHTILSH